MSQVPAPQRRPDGTLLPGSTANPSGRPRIVGEVQSLARGHAPAAFARVVTLVENADPRVALAAAQEVLNRAWGKPIAQVKTETKKYDMSALYLAGLQIANGATPSGAARVIEWCEIEEMEDDGAAIGSDDMELESNSAALSVVEW